MNKITYLEKVKIIKIESLNLEVEAKCWKLGFTSIDDTNKKMSFTLNLYQDENSKDFIESYTVTDLMQLEDKSIFDSYFNSDIDRKTACYQYALDNVEFFKDAKPIYI